MRRDGCRRVAGGTRPQNRVGVPSAWETIPPEASLAARERGSAASLRRILGDELAGSPGLVGAADLTTKAATSAPTAGRVMYAGMRTLADRATRSPGCGTRPPR